jgi:hypothetical protein
MTTDENDNGWDALADDLGLQPSEPAPKAEKPAPSPRSAARPAGGREHREPRPEIEQDADDFGSGVTAEPEQRSALYDPGPGAMMEDADDLVADEAAEPIDDGAEGDEPLDTAEEGPPQEGGKRRRRRRRRKKKGGAPDEAPAEGEPVAEAADGQESEGVEEGEAPAPFEGDDDEEVPHSAVEEEMEAEAAQPRPEWHVMTWNELVSKLHRPN